MTSSPPSTACTTWATRRPLRDTSRKCSPRTGPGCWSSPLRRGCRCGQPQPGRSRVLQLLHDAGAYLTAISAGAGDVRWATRPVSARSEPSAAQQVSPGSAAQPRRPSTSCTNCGHAGTLELPGASLYYEVSGTGVPVVLIHGLALDLQDVGRDQVPARCAARRPSSVTTYGVSAARRAPTMCRTPIGTTCGDCSTNSVSRPPCWSDLSMGGGIGLKATIDAPSSRVLALVLLDAVVDGVPWDDGSVAGMRAIAEGLRSDGLTGAKAAWLRHDFFGAAGRSPELSARLAAMVEDYSGAALGPTGPARAGAQRGELAVRDRRADHSGGGRARRAVLPHDGRRAREHDPRRATDRRAQCRSYGEHGGPGRGECHPRPGRETDPTPLTAAERGRIPVPRQGNDAPDLSSGASAPGPSGASITLFELHRGAGARTSDS